MADIALLAELTATVGFSPKPYSIVWIEYALKAKEDSPDSNKLQDIFFIIMGN